MILDLHSDDETATYGIELNFTLTFCFSAELAFTFRPVSGVRVVELRLIGGDCEINCDGSTRNCSLPLDRYTMKNVSSFIVRTYFISRFKIKIHSE
jgi:hypothetical protein